MLKKYLLLLIFVKFILIISFSSFIVSAEFIDIKDTLIDISDDNLFESTEDDGISLLVEVFKWVKDSIRDVLMLIAVWAFLFIWIRLGMARGNPEEFKKWLIHLVYTIVWIFIVVAAWALVKIVAWISF